MTSDSASSIVAGTAEGPVLAASLGLSFWGGVDPTTAHVIDAHHPLHGEQVAGSVLMMPTSRGSCSGSGVMLDLALNARAPAALIFSEAEDILTLGSLIAGEVFGCGFPVLRVSAAQFATLSKQVWLKIEAGALIGDGLCIPISRNPTAELTLTDEDRAVRDGRDGPAAALAMRIICTVAAQQGATRLTDIARGHIDGCIYAHPANLIFAKKMAEMGASVRVPTTINAISVDRQNWRSQGVPARFGAPASRLADAYVGMGCQPTFTCAPYLLDDPPQQGESIAWAESNAVIYANTVLGARTLKHPDYLDLCMAVTGRAPLSGVYIDAERRARVVLDIEVPTGADDAIWPLIGYVAGLKSPDRIPLLTGLGQCVPSRDDLKAMCAAFGTTSAAPMLHIEGITPEAAGAASPGTARIGVTLADSTDAWRQLNNGPETVDLVAIGSPHASLIECHALAKALEGRSVRIATIVTAGRNVIALAKADGTLSALTDAGVQVFPDLYWCSITEPLFPPITRAVMTNSGKYAHYGPGLSGRALRFGGLAACAAAAISGHASSALPAWLTPDTH
ncbi:cis-3-hydroxy-L-proline dehydratase [Yoonia vestfoldensis]|uniref:cis-3-hydroxy-L-proline dehydratase n=1 Tax=Yoonia vestfoldensis TaxID=245188 RepID=UPI0003A1AC84|nr:aconitase family protein [Yoonia vestfoldensis]